MDQVRGFLINLSNLVDFKLGKETQDPIRKFEDVLAQRGDVHFLLNKEDLERPEISRYLLLTSIPFAFYEDLEHGQIEGNRLKEMWKPGLDMCSVCPDIITRLTMPTGNLYPKIMVIAEAPGVGDGAKETFDRVLVYGPTSWLLRQALFDCGAYYSTWFTNLLKCSLPNNRSGTNTEYETCFQYLNVEINKLSPPLVILFGARVHSFFRSYGLSCIPKKSEIGPKDGIFKNSSVVSMSHPSYYLRKGLVDEFTKDLQSSITDVISA